MLAWHNICQIPHSDLFCWRQTEELMMDMKQHILAALREEFNSWEELLASMSEAQITASNQHADGSVKDVIAHLMAWQQRSIARTEAALLNREPVFPTWAAGIDPESYADTDQINAWISEAHRERPWSDVHQEWRAGFLRFLELGAAISEKDLLDSGRYAWLQGHSLAMILLGSYDHHQEHLEQLRA
jgi:hypothetical protein